MNSLNWHWWPGHTPYDQTMLAMQNYIENMHKDPLVPETIWGVEHESIYTAGTSANSSELIHAHFPVIQTNRGGKYTYHGPGQLVVYPLLNLRKHQIDPRTYVRKLEQWMQAILASCGIKAEPHPEHIGLWVDNAKIGAIGVRVSRGIAWHGFSINVNVNLDHFSGIIPCGLHRSVTSLHALGWQGSLSEVWQITQDQHKKLFK